MKRYFMFAAAAALAAGILLAQTPAPTPQPGAKGRPGANMVRRRAMRALDLTDAQKEQAKAIFQQARKKAEPIRQQLQTTHQALAAAVKANDTAQIQALASQQGTLQGQAAAIRAESMAKFYSILTPEQRAKSDQVQQRVQQRMQKRFGRG